MLVRELSPQGFEATYAANHFGGAALFNLLAASGVFAPERPCRVVAVRSMARAAANARGRDGPYRRGRAFLVRYGNSKLFNHLWSFQVDKRFRARGVTSNSLHPGAGLFTGLGCTDAGPLLRYTLVPLLALLSPLMWVVAVVARRRRRRGGRGRQRRVATFLLPAAQVGHDPAGDRGREGAGVVMGRDAAPTSRGRGQARPPGGLPRRSEASSWGRPCLFR